MKKIFLLAICLCSVFAFFTACNGDEQDPTPGLTTDDLQGEKFYYLGSIIIADPSDEDKDIEPGTLPYMESREDEVMYNQCLFIEQTYNCKIIRSGFNFDSTSAFASAFAAGNVNADFCTASFKELRDYYQAGILEDLEQLENLDASDEAKWGIEAKRDAGRYGGVLYAFPVAGSMYVPRFLTYSGAIIYNYVLYEDFNIGTTPKEMVEEGDWTFDNFLTLIQDCSDLSGQRPIYGLENQCSLLSIAIGANGSNVIVNRNGKFVSGLTVDATVNALEWVRKLNQTGCIGGNIANDTAVFAAMTSDNAIKTECPTVHWVPMPTGPDSTEETNNTGAYFGYHEKGTSVFKHTADPDRKELTAFVMDKLFAPTDEWGETGYDEYMSRNFFDTVDDYNVYKEQSINMIYNYGLEVLSDSEFADSFMNIMNGSVEASFTGSIKNQLSSLTTALNERICKPMNEANKRG